MTYRRRYRRNDWCSFCKSYNILYNKLTSTSYFNHPFLQVTLLVLLLHECSCTIEFINRKEFSEYNNTEARMLDATYHRTLKYLTLAFFCAKRRKLFYLVHDVIMDVNT